MKEANYTTFNVLDSIILNKPFDRTVFAEDKAFDYRDTIAIKK